MKRVWAGLKRWCKAIAATVENQSVKNPEREKFIPILQPHDATQAGFIRSTLELNDIVCYVNNENVSSVRFGGIGMGAAGMMVMVPESQAEKARQLISDLGLGLQ